MRNQLTEKEIKYFKDKYGYDIDPVQIELVESLFAFFYSDKKNFILQGPAGSSKTVCIAYFGDLIYQRERVVPKFLTLTGKASSVLRKKDMSGASTIHSYIYMNRYDNDTGTWENRLKKPHENPFKLFIVDEFSHISDELLQDMLSFNVKIIFSGDLQQLKFDMSDYFLNPDYTCTKIFRQAKDSYILDISQEILKTGVIDDEYINPKLTEKDLFNYDQVISFHNATRRGIIDMMRESKGYGKEPEIGEPIIYLQNDTDNDIFNGTIETIRNIKKIESDKEIYNINGNLCYFSEKNENDFYVTPQPGLTGIIYKKGKYIKGYSIKVHSISYSYCLTGHKSQGSEWDNVLVVLDNYSKAYLYTATTRAKTRVDYIEVV